MLFFQTPDATLYFLLMVTLREGFHYTHRLRGVKLLYLCYAVVVACAFFKCKIQLNKIPVQQGAIVPYIGRAWMALIPPVWKASSIKVWLH